ncbi:tail assembly chaperone [Mycobacterium phage Bipper]|uniref:Tail assembly chaperone n=1 Tax=Mycobacterium phage Bipper TaxID=1805457 RepID=A0A142F2F0_9CAUD|nr:tail assembly chaperone [Mycobacterium phage Bipper]AMQ66957.1 tail assembly chaperone [Mycobacterium phage Bipper]
MTTPRKAPARKAAPRKRTAAAKSKAAAQPAAVESTAAADPTPDADPASGVLAALSRLYPKGSALFVFTATDGTKIPFPKFSTVPQPPRSFFWQLYQLEPLFQGFEWMKRAGVPMEIQAIAVEFPEADYDRLFDEWFADSQLTAGGIGALTRAIAAHWHAVERDLIELGKDEDFDAGRLGMAKLGSIVLAAQPGTAVYHAVNEGWTPEAHLLANQLEQRAGLLNMARRMPRTGVPAETPQPPPTNPRRVDSWDSLPLEEFERLRQANYAQGPAPSRKPRGRVSQPRRR